LSYLSGAFVAVTVPRATGVATGATAAVGGAGLAFLATDVGEGDAVLLEDDRSDDFGGSGTVLADRTDPISLGDRVRSDAEAPVTIIQLGVGSVVHETTTIRGWKVFPLEKAEGPGRGETG